MGTRIENNDNETRLTAYDYVVSLISFIKRDIDIEYYEILSKAIEYGLKPKEFWDCDIQEFYCYQIASINTTYNNAHKQGFYNFIALSTVIGNIFLEKGKKPLEYPSMNIYNPIGQKRSHAQPNEPKSMVSKLAQTESGTKSLFHILDRMKGVNK